ncbi:V-type ATPase 116kDa subunit family protein [Stetteria hydrogenophila]
MSRRVEEVIVAVPYTFYDRVVKEIAEAGLMQVAEPPRELGVRPDVSMIQAFNEASERVSKIESFFRAIGLEPRLLRGVEVRISGWASGVREVAEEYSGLEREFEEGLSQIEELETRLRELHSIRELLESIKHVDADLRAASQAKRVSFSVGLAPAEAAALAGEIASREGVVVAVDEAGEGKAVIAVAGDGVRVLVATAQLRGYGWSPLWLPEWMPGNPAKAHEEASRAAREMSERIESIKRRLSSLADKLAEYYTKMYVLREVLRILANTARVKTMALIRGFVDTRDRKKLERLLGDATGGAYLMVSLGARRAEERVPSKVEVPRFLRPFQRVLELYGHPEPGEIVPTVFMAVTMPVIFGLMFPDAGHGLLVIAFALLYMAKRSRDWGILAAILGAAGVVGGILAGEFFGPLTGKPLVEMWRSLGFEAPPLSLGLHEAVEGEADLAAALLHRGIGISLWIAAFMLTLGTLLAVVDALLKGEAEEAVASKLPKFILFASATLPFLLTLDPHKAGSVISEAVFGPRESALSKVVFYGSLTGIAWLMLGKPVIGLATGRGAGFGEAFMEAFESILMVVGNIPSFLRILGLGLAHSGLMLGFTMMTIPLLNGPAGYVAGALVYATGNLLTAGLESIIAFAHNLRLHFYEWFSKFYSGTGIPFTPVRIPEGVTIVITA